MLETIGHGDVTELRLSTRRTRAARFAVSAFVSRGVLVDTGFTHVRRDVIGWARAHPPVGGLVTHHHEDHAGNVVALASLGIPFGMAPATRDLLRTRASLRPYQRVLWGTPPAMTEDAMPFSSAALTLLHTPGHTDDHHVVWDAERGTMFGGDLYIGTRVMVARPGEDLRGQPAVLRAMAALAPARYFDAHRGLLDRPVERLRAKADWMDETIARMDALAAQGRSPREIQRLVIGGFDLSDWVTGGDYSRANFVASVLTARPTPDPRSTNGGARQ